MSTRTATSRLLPRSYFQIALPRITTQVLVSLLEMGAPILSPGAEELNRSTLYEHDRPLTIELIERLLHWLVPLRERIAAVGLGRRQAMLPLFATLPPTRTRRENAQTRFCRALI